MHWTMLNEDWTNAFQIKNNQGSKEAAPEWQQHQQRQQQTTNNEQRTTNERNKQMQSDMVFGLDNSFLRGHALPGASSLEAPGLKLPWLLPPGLV